MARKNNRSSRSSTLRSRPRMDPRFSIPSYQSNYTVPVHLRFSVAAGPGSTNVRSSDICSSLGVMAATATTAYPFFKYIKLKRIEVWGNTDATNLLGTASILFGNAVEDNVVAREFSDSTVSSAVPAHVVAIPPAGSQASFWQINTNTDILFTFYYPDSAIIDVYVDAILADSNTAPPAITVSGATAGIVYYQPLDGDGGVLTPVSRNLAS